MHLLFILFFFLVFISIHININYINMYFINPEEIILSYSLLFFLIIIIYVGSYMLTINYFITTWTLYTIFEYIILLNIYLNLVIYIINNITISFHYRHFFNNLKRTHIISYDYLINLYIINSNLITINAFLNLLLNINKITFNKKKVYKLTSIKYIIDRGYDYYITFYLYRDNAKILNNTKNISYFN